MTEDEFDALDQDLERRLRLAEEMVDVVMDALGRGHNFAAFAEGRLCLMVRRDGVAIFEEADLGAGTVPGAGAN